MLQLQRNFNEKIIDWPVDEFKGKEQLFYTAAAIKNDHVRLFSINKVHKNGWLCVRINLSDGNKRQTHRCH